MCRSRFHCSTFGSLNFDVDLGELNGLNNLSLINYVIAFNASNINSENSNPHLLCKRTKTPVSERSNTMVVLQYL